jgi:hypothetical protein
MSLILEHGLNSWKWIWARQQAPGFTLKEMEAAAHDEREASLVSLLNMNHPGKGNRLSPDLQPYVSSRTLWCLLSSFPEYYLKSFVIIIFKAN